MGDRRSVPRFVLMRTRPTLTETESRHLPGSADEVEQLFDQLAPRYDMLNHLFSFGLDFTWRWRTASRLRPAVAGPLLDGATGSGDLAISLARRYRDREVVGLDFSAGMLELAPVKALKRGVTERTSWQQGDLTDLPFADDHFAAATVAFGLRNVFDRPAAMREFHRVLKPGGRLLVLEFAMPTMPLFAPVYKWYFRHVMPPLAGLVGMGRAYRYLYKSVDEFPVARDFCEAILDAGFTSAIASPMTFGTVMLYEATKG